MIGRLNGRLIEKNPTDLLIECGGVGYEVKISLNTFSQLGSDEAVQVFTKLIVREDAHILYGFANKEEREMFNHLVSVSGIGPNTAMIMLSSLVPDEIAQAILTEDVTTIQKIKGIVDSGYIGIKKLQNTSLLPKKRSRGKALTRDEKQINHDISSERALNENVIGRLKRFKILSDKYRNRRKRFGLRFNLIAGIQNWELKHDDCRSSSTKTNSFGP